MLRKVEKLYMTFDSSQIMNLCKDCERLKEKFGVDIQELDICCPICMTQGLRKWKIIRERNQHLKNL